MSELQGPPGARADPPPTPQRCWGPPGWKVLCTGKAQSWTPQRVPGTTWARPPGGVGAAALLKCRGLGPRPGESESLMMGLRPLDLG